MDDQTAPQARLTGDRTMEARMNDELQDEEVLLAGHGTRAGVYRELGTGRLVILEQDDVLPATLDGRIACYVPISHTWAQINARLYKQEKGRAV
jgi:hypothetical protein